ncbi:hypothetical protein [Tessaracoccus coleopterorum]|uniref:hypothetical protein n=1 Tax=Tessaracoccus coleopterorum TaxID=2714950 RepID=UPI0018D34EFD|nr:hypothetical protein [Tessaracoccus coleopterorum]
MLGVVKGQVEAGGGDATSGWDFADVYPGGAANWAARSSPSRPPRSTPRRRRNSQPG